MPDWALFWTLLKNLHRRELSRESLGSRIEMPIAPVSPEEALEFAAATNDANPVYGIQGGPLPPLYIAKLVIDPLKRFWRMPALRVNLLRMVHAEQSVRWHRTLPNSAAMRLQVTLSDIRRTPAGDLLEIDGLCLVDGRPAVEGVTGLLVRSRRKSRKDSPAPANRGERFRIPIPTLGDQPRRYARISGDNNFIHTSDFMARAAGFPRTVLHGACVMSMACTALADRLVQNDPERLCFIRGRFSRPAVPGQVLTLVGYEGEDPFEVPFAVYEPGGAPVFKNGVFGYR